MISGCALKWVTRLMAVMLIGLLMPCGVWAKVYKYVDSSGTVHYTDNALEVPADQRPPLEEVSRKVEEKTAVGTQSAPSSAQATPGALVKKEAVEKQKTHMDTRFEMLDRGRQELDAELDAINRERQQLEKERVIKHSKRTYRIYNQKIKKLDARIKAYNTRRVELNSQVEAYNAKMRQFDEQRNRLNAEIETFNQAKVAESGSGS